MIARLRRGGAELTAVLIGLAMILAGGYLELIGRSGALLIIFGAVLTLVGLVGFDRLRTVEFSRTGGKMTWAERSAGIDEAIGSASKPGQTVYWTPEALDAIRRAYEAETTADTKMSLIDSSVWSLRAKPQSANRRRWSTSASVPTIVVDGPRLTRRARR
jgi:hypothetical protein